MEGRIFSLAEELLKVAEEKGVWLATAESCTGGLIAGAITDVPGSSNVFDRAFVTYSNDAKKDMLGVRGETLERVGAVSEEVAGEMALNAILRSRATITVAVTGLAGPGGSEFKPEGRVCFGVSVKNGSTVTETVDFGAIGRRNVRLSTVERALNLLLKHAKETGNAKQ